MPLPIAGPAQQELLFPLVGMIFDKRLTSIRYVLRFFDLFYCCACVCVCATDLHPPRPLLHTPTSFISFKLTHHERKSGHTLWSAPFIYDTTPKPPTASTDARNRMILLFGLSGGERERERERERSKKKTTKHRNIGRASKCREEGR